MPAKRVSFAKRGKSSSLCQPRENTLEQVPGYEFEGECTCTDVKEYVRFFVAGTRGSMANGGK